MNLVHECNYVVSLILFNIIGYGLTETSGSSHIVPSGKTIENKQGSIGLLVPNMQCKVNYIFVNNLFKEIQIVNTSTRAEVSTNKSGEILLRGPNVMKGYFGKASASEKAFENGWFKTGIFGITFFNDDLKLNELEIAATIYRSDS